MRLPSTLHRAAPWAWAATVILAALLCVLTLSPQGPAVGPPRPDKLYHFIGFGLLAVPLCLVYPHRAWTVVVGVIAFGAAIEVIQPYVGRGAEWGDLLADALGAAGAAGLARMLPRKRPRSV
ncbi:VanZ family protein [Roseovarius sp. M141]|uniref:VanZ family protein n=1 Tax=Roseovarius sp. M141 TaxID=2583806 RepID=UPI0020CC7209|nr:VanZ family protein [Roseovarius sp. M141]MCQ0090990.1 VanZ family protein [Roseovarius sp. M141]